jgi:hypothetical protein
MGGGLGATSLGLKLRGEIMNKIFFLFVVSLSLFLWSCEEDSIGIDDYSIVYEDHTSTPYQFPEGVYYSYTFENQNSRNFNETIVLDQIMQNGINLKDSWYKKYSSSCTPPGSNISMMVIVPAEFLIRVDQVSNKLNDLGFTQITDPGITFCSYSVKHYIYK